MVDLNLYLIVIIYVHRNLRPISLYNFEQAVLAFHQLSTDLLNRKDL